jgi:hypothetical protein
MAMPTAAEHFIEALSSFKSHRASFNHLHNVVHRPKRLVAARVIVAAMPRKPRFLRRKIVALALTAPASHLESRLKAAVKRPTRSLKKPTAR